MPDMIKVAMVAGTKMLIYKILQKKVIINSHTISFMWLHTLYLCNYFVNESQIISTYFLIGRVDEKDSLILSVRNAPATTKTRSSTYVPLLVTPSVDATIATLITETCGDNIECAYDIAVTGNVEVGRETLNDIKEHMIIINQTLPSMFMYIFLIEF